MAPLCHFCRSTPMDEKVRMPLGAGKETVIYQCSECRRIESQTE